mgnify:CR=1 FL=1
MPRARKGAARQRAKKRIPKAVKGYVGGRHRLYRTAKETLDRARVYAFRDRRRRKRDFRRLWITRIGAACRGHQMSYSRFIQGLKAAQIELDRKMLAELAVSDPTAFDKLLDVARQNVSA